MRVFAITYTIAALLAFVSASPLVIENHNLASRAVAVKDCGEVGSKKYCEGTKVSSNKLYLCGDERLGPANLPGGPLTQIVASWQRFGDLCPGEFIKKWTDTKGQWKYPPQDGFKLASNGKPMMKTESLKVGTLLDRFGHEGGKYLAPAGTPYGQRAIPPSNLNPPSAKEAVPYYKYEVVKSFKAESGPAAPWFGQKGEGVQYKVAEKVMDLVSKGFLRRIKL
ncbi:hypothetical protein HGRIS_000341 [Hohenbuehelia grisea]|uniref:TNT domain-containing protein n=1 Tax=Hohenbuehelia grisea TaxID=104357 RepID=A0ABR3JSC1_9AGAR